MGVGKSSILSQYIKHEFPESPLPTIAIEFATKIVNTKEGGSIKAQIWDTAGQEKYKSITAHHYRKAVGALLVYDVTKKQTFESCLKWYSELLNYTEKGCIICLVGNKIDLLEDNPNLREVNTIEAKRLAKKYNMIFFETSAKSNKNVHNCFADLIQEIYEYKRKNDNNNSSTFVINKDLEKEKSQTFGCC